MSHRHAIIYFTFPYINHCVMKIFMHKALCTCRFIFLRKILRSGITRSNKLVVFKAFNFFQIPFWKGHDGLQDDMRVCVLLLPCGQNTWCYHEKMTICWRMVSFLLKQRLDIIHIMKHPCLLFCTFTYSFYPFFSIGILVFFPIICISSLQEHWPSVSHICWEHFLSFPSFHFFCFLWPVCVNMCM